MNTNQLLKRLKKEQTQYLLILLLVFYIILPIQTPNVLSIYIDSLLGRIILIAVAVSLLFYHPILGAISIFAVYELIHRSEKSTGSYQARKFLPSEFNKINFLDSQNQFPTTLEEEVVQRMVPNKDTLNTKPSFKPMTNNIFNVTSL